MKRLPPATCSKGPSNGRSIRPAGAAVLEHREPGDGSSHDRNRPPCGRPATRSRAGRVWHEQRHGVHPLQELRAPVVRGRVFGYRNQVPSVQDPEPVLGRGEGRPRTPASVRNRRRIVGKSPQRKPPGRNGFKYKPRYGVIVEVRDAATQKRVYETLAAKYKRVKAVTV